MSHYQTLAEQWRKDAEVLRANACEQIAVVTERHAAQLEAAARAHDDESLTLEEAAKEGNYSIDRLRHMVADGVVPNAGRKGAPRIKRKDLPRKARRTNGFDAEAAARSILAKSGQ